jgi:hypothetical protein
VAKLTQLDTLNLGRTNITDAGLHRLRNLRASKELSPGCSAAAGAGISEIATLPGLTKLQLTFTKLKDSDLPVLKGVDVPVKIVGRIYRALGECAGRAPCGVARLPGLRLIPAKYPRPRRSL